MMDTPGNLNVLIADGDNDLLEELTDLFQLFQIDVGSAHSGDEAWSKIQENPVDIVISEISKNANDGIRLLEKIKKQDTEKPKVMMVADADGGKAEEVYALGADAFFLKPLEASTVRDFLWQSAKAPNERWESSIDLLPSSHITNRFQSLEVAAKQGAFRLGRLGFFYKMTSGLPKTDDWIDFSITFSQDPNINELNGRGKVRWVRKRKSQDLDKGIGVEIKYLEPDCIDEIRSYIASLNKPVGIPRK
jgi:CheY-like chemotaxis protein